MQEVSFTYPQLRSTILDKQLLWQYIENSSFYQIFTIDLLVTYTAFVYKTGFTVGGLDPTVEQANQTDFETNYKSTANVPLDGPIKTTLNDWSGTTSGTSNTSTEIIPANIGRKYLFVQNVGVSTIWINFSQAANQGQPSIQLSPGASFVMEGASITTEAINAISQEISIPYTAKDK